VKKFYIGASAFGKGLFATHLIKKGEVILKFQGPLITFKQTLKTKDGIPLQIGPDCYIYLRKPGRFANHSCSPNTSIKKDHFLVALKDINKGEELFFDYSTAMDEDCWTLKCMCNSKNCRKLITDFKYLPKKPRDKYLKLGIVQKFISEQF